MATTAEMALASRLYDVNNSLMRVQIMGEIQTKALIRCMCSKKDLSEDEMIAEFHKNVDALYIERTGISLSKNLSIGEPILIRYKRNGDHTQWNIREKNENTDL
jgi:hypothetical protein